MARPIPAELARALTRAQFATLEEWRKAANVKHTVFYVYRAGGRIPKKPLERLATAIRLPPHVVASLIVKRAA